MPSTTLPYMHGRPVDTTSYILRRLPLVRAETARWSRESADFWLSDDEPLGALPPMRQVGPLPVRAQGGCRRCCWRGVRAGVA